MVKAEIRYSLTAVFPKRSRTFLRNVVNRFRVVSREAKDYRQGPIAIDPDTIRDLVVVADSNTTGSLPQVLE